MLHHGPMWLIFSLVTYQPIMVFQWLLRSHTCSHVWRVCVDDRWFKFMFTFCVFCITFLSTTSLFVLGSVYACLCISSWLHELHSTAWKDLSWNEKWPVVFSGMLNATHSLTQCLVRLPRTVCHVCPCHLINSIQCTVSTLMDPISTLFGLVQY